MLRKILSIMSLVISGFFIYMVTLIAFIKVPSNEKFLISGIFIIPVILFHLVGLYIVRFKNWMRNTGIVILSGAGVTTLVLLSLITVSMSEEFKTASDVNPLEYFNQWFMGGFVLLISISIGLTLLLKGIKTHTS